MPGKQKKHRVKLIKGRVLYAFEKTIEEIPLELRATIRPSTLARRAHRIYAAEVPAALPRPRFSTFRNLVIGKKTDSALISRLKKEGIVKKLHARFDQDHLKKSLNLSLAEATKMPLTVKALSESVYALYCKSLPSEAVLPSRHSFPNALKKYCHEAIAQRMREIYSRWLSEEERPIRENQFLARRRVPVDKDQFGQAVGRAVAFLKAAKKARITRRVLSKTKIALAAHQIYCKTLAPHSRPPAKNTFIAYLFKYEDKLIADGILPTRKQR